MTMRLLLANGNTNAALTEVLARSARAAASPGTEIVTATAAHGVPVIQTAADAAAAFQPLLDAVRERVTGCDGVLVGVSLDLGVDALEQQVSRPVVGMTGAALAVAGRQGRRVGVITLGDDMTTLLRQRFPELDSMLVETIDMAPAEALAQRGNAGALLDLLSAATQRLAARGAQAVVPIGATLGGLGPRVAAQVPVLDCIACAVSELERLVHARRRATP